MFSESLDIMSRFIGPRFSRRSAQKNPDGENIFFVVSKRPCFLTLTWLSALPAKKNAVGLLKKAVEQTVESVAEGLGSAIYHVSPAYLKTTKMPNELYAEDGAVSADKFRPVLCGSCRVRMTWEGSG